MARKQPEPAYVPMLLRVCGRCGAKHRVLVWDRNDASAGDGEIFRERRQQLIVKRARKEKFHVYRP
jgi:hypothetical protein